MKFASLIVNLMNTLSGGWRGQRKIQVYRESNREENRERERSPELTSKYRLAIRNKNLYLFFAIRKLILFIKASRTVACFSLETKEQCLKFNSEG